MKEIYNMGRQEDTPVERKETKICRLQELLKAHQRPPRHKCKPKGAEGRWKRRKGALTRRAQQQQLKGVVTHSACVGHHVTVFCKARGQRYGVLSNGCKFHGLCRQYRRRARHRSRARKEDKADYLQTRDQEQYFKACIKSVLMANPQLQPA